MIVVYIIINLILHAAFLYKRSAKLKSKVSYLMHHIYSPLFYDDMVAGTIAEKLQWLAFSLVKFIPPRKVSRQ